MLFDILRRDLKRQKTMNLIILLFVVLSVMFIASSVNNLLAVSGSLGAFFDRAGVGDYVTFERSGGSVTVKDAAAKAKGVRSVRQEECIFLSNHEFESASLTQDTQSSNTSLVSCLSHKIQNYYDSRDNEITEVADGETYVRHSLLTNNGVKAGDRVTLTVSNVSRTFVVKDSLKDAVLGSRMMGNTRFLISENDYRAFEKAEPLEPYRFYFTFIDTDDTASLQKELMACDAVAFSLDREMLRFTYIMEMIVAGILLIVSVCLIIIAVVILRFTISFTLSEEYRSIGIMKAIGITNGKIRSLYLVKYLALALLGAAAGLALSFPFGGMLLDVVSESIVMDDAGGALLGTVCSAGVVGVILLFSFLSTRRVTTYTPVDAIHSGETGERYGKKGVLRLGQKPIRPAFFMAVNDILSSPKRFLTMLLTFFVGASILMILLNVSSTLQSGKLLAWMNMADCDAVICEKGAIEKYMVEDGREKIDRRIADIKKALSEKGWEADCFMETLSGVQVSFGGNTVKTPGVEGIGISPAEYAYLEGTAPQNKREIAVSYIIADKLHAGIGDTVRVITAEGETECMITATYQSMMSMGDSIRLYPGQTHSFRLLTGLNDFQIRFADSPDANEIERRMESLRGMFPDDKVMNAGDYVDYIIGGISGILDSVTALLLPVIILIDILVAVLMEKSFLAKERGEIAMLKAIGFGSRSVIRWQTLRIGLVMALAVGLAAALADPLGRLTTGGLFVMMGAKNIIFDADVLRTYVFCPAIVLAATVGSVFLTALSVRKVNSNEINSVE